MSQSGAIAPDRATRVLVRFVAATSQRVNTLPRRWSCSCALSQLPACSEAGPQGAILNAKRLFVDHPDATIATSWLHLQGWGLYLCPSGAHNPHPLWGQWTPTTRVWLWGCGGGERGMTANAQSSCTGAIARGLTFLVRMTGREVGIAHCSLPRNNRPEETASQASHHCVSLRVCTHVPKSDHPFPMWALQCTHSRFRQRPVAERAFSVRRCSDSKQPRVCAWSRRLDAIL